MRKVVTLPVTPVGKPRMTQSDKWNKRPEVLRYRAFADELRLRCPSIDDINRCEITFFLPVMASWSRKKRCDLVGKPHTSKPDLDNLCKAFFDALYKDDAHVHTIRARKLWGAVGMIHILLPRGA